ncbi:MAG: hypothetical protein ACR2PG_22790 [Hyphomicrobiaceae bacterium]
MEHGVDLTSLYHGFLREVLHLKTGENLLVYADTNRDKTIADDLLSCAQMMGIETEFFQLNTFANLQEASEGLFKKIGAGSYDAVCELSEQYYYPTRAWAGAVEKGCRIYALGPMDRGGFVRCFGAVNHEKLAVFGTAIQEALSIARDIRIESNSGTKLHLRMNTSWLAKQMLALLNLKTRCSWVGQPTGRLRREGGATFLPGQVSFLGIPKSIEGRAVIDGYMWPPKELGHLQDPIVLTIKQGRVVTISGCETKAKLLSHWLRGKKRRIEHFCVGFHPGARVAGNLIEAERAFGHIAIGLGQFPFHTDAIMTRPKLVADGSVLIDDQSFKDRQLPSLAELMTAH